jgi:hypothetical protein
MKNWLLLEHFISKLKRELESGNPDFDNYKVAVKNQLQFFYHKETKLNGSLYRGSLIDDQEFTKAIYASRFSYPDPKKGINVTLGRANIPDNPVCYLAQNEFGAVLETLYARSLTNKYAGRSQFVYVSEWRVKPNTISLLYDATSRVPLNNRSFDQKETKIYNRFLALWEQCYLSENAYNFSSKLSHMFLYNRGPSKPNIDLIRYPSVVDRRICKDFQITQPEDLECINFAIHPDFFDRHYEFVSAIGFVVPDNFATALPDYFKEGRMDIIGYFKVVRDPKYDDGRLVRLRL